MSGTDKTGADTHAILNGFERLLIAHQEATQKSQDKSNAKLDKLVETVTTLTQSHIESRKDREYDQARMERLDQNQREQGKELTEIANQLILINERQANGKNTIERWTNVVNAVGVAGILAYLGFK